MNIDEIRVQITEALDAIEVARLVRNDELHAVDAKCFASQKPHKAALADLQEKYRRIALNIADPPPSCGCKCPEHCEDDRRDPDHTWIGPVGISFRWDADHPNDIRDYLVEWEKIAAVAS